MRIIITTVDELSRINRYLVTELEEIARIAGHFYASNDDEHDALLDCAAIAHHALDHCRKRGPS